MFISKKELIDLKTTITNLRYDVGRIKDQLADIDTVLELRRMTPAIRTAELKERTDLLAKKLGLKFKTVPSTPATITLESEVPPDVIRR